MCGGTSIKMRIMLVLMMMMMITERENQGELQQSNNNNNNAGENGKVHVKIGGPIFRNSTEEQPQRCLMNTKGVQCRNNSVVWECKHKGNEERKEGRVVFIGSGQRNNMARDLCFFVVDIQSRRRNLCFRIVLVLRL